MELSTPEILRRYDPEFETKRVSLYHFIALIESWIRDLAFRWKDGDPPGLAESSGVGLMDRLKGGMTWTYGEVTLGADSLR